MIHQRLKVLVTGASGFIGMNIARYLKERSIVMGTYFNHPYTMMDIPMLSLDLRDGRALAMMVFEMRPYAVVHCAALTDAEFCEKNRALASLINVEGTRRLARVARDIGARMIYLSTDLVFNGEKGWYREDDPVSPVQMYGETKVRGEEAIMEEHDNAAILRVGLVYGSSPLETRSASEWPLHEIQQGRTPTLFTDQFRTPTSALNIARVVGELLDHSFTGILHVAGPDRMSRYEFGCALLEAYGVSLSRIKPGSIEDLPSVSTRPRDSSLNTDLARSLLKTPLLGVNEGLWEIVLK
ncbi:MAG: SDR family oxidoreductase [Candidatus Tectomicrobia bacterium]|nr:SDR family oxidoreductase [Candidatus Tectomicrobia bacterium]